MKPIVSSLVCVGLPLILLSCSGDQPEPEVPEAPDAPETTEAGADAVAPPAAAAEEAPSSASSEAAELGASGSVTHQGQTMKIEGGVAVWDAEDAKLKVTLLPFQPTEAEIERIRKDETFFAVSDREKGIQGFDDRTPYAFLSLGWPFEEADIGQVDKAFCHLYIGFLKENGSNMNLNFQASDKNKGPLEFEGKLEVGTEIRVRLEGEDELLGDSMSWDLQFSGPIQAGIED